MKCHYQEICIATVSESGLATQGELDKETGNLTKQVSLILDL